MARGKPQKLSEEIGETLMLLTRDFQRRLDEDLGQRGISGLSARHRSVFLYLYYHGPSRAADLAEAAGIRPQSMMTAIHELEALGLITRATDPNDSRAKLIRFTNKGEKLTTELAASSETVWQQYAERVGEARLQRLFSGLRKLLDETQ